MNSTLAKIGALLSITAIPLFLVQVWLLFPVWDSWRLLNVISYPTWYLLVNVPVLSQTVAGLTLYVIGRKSFWKQPEYEEGMLILGALLFFGGWLLNLLAKINVEEMVYRLVYLSIPLDPWEPFTSVLPLMWISILVETGVLLMVDFAGLSLKGLTGAVVATASLLLLSQLVLLPTPNMPAGFGVLVFLAFGASGFSSIWIALISFTLLGVALFAASIFKWIWGKSG